MKTISIRELHAKTGEWVRLAQHQEQIIITDRGRPVAALAPYRTAANLNRFSARKLLPAYRKLTGNSPAGLTAALQFLRRAIANSCVIYFDAAYIAKFYLEEPDSSRVSALAESAGEVACCLHGRIEVLSVFHRKMRERAFAPKAFAAVCDQFDADCEALVWEWLPVSAALVADLSKRLRQLPAEVFIRAADALHLGSAVEQGFNEIYSTDRHVLAAAPHFGLRGMTV